MVKLQSRELSFFLENGRSQQSTRRYLLCYVPALLIGAADAGIEGNPESCIVWLDQTDASIRQRVKALTSSGAL